MSNEASIQGTLGEVLDRLSRDLGQFPRRVPGTLKIDGQPIVYSDLHSFFHQAYQIYVQKLYDLDTEKPIRSILDCGAHIGLASIYYAGRFPDAEIHGFEADPELCQMASLNVRQLGLGNRIHLHPKAVWIDDNGIGFHRTGDDSGIVSNAGSVRVPSFSLRDWIEHHDVDLIKMDIEGAEYSVLKDCKDVLGSVPYVLIEAHQFGRNEGHLHEILAILSEAGFETGLGDFHPATWIPQHTSLPFKACPNKHFVITIFAWRE